MYEVGDYVINSGNGICRIEEKMQLDMEGIDKNQWFFLVVPVEEQSTKLYIPVEKIGDKTRMVMNEGEAWHLMDDVARIDELEIPNDRLREQIYKQALLSNDPAQLIRVIKTIFVRKQQRAAEGKKNTVVDERYFKLAENNLYDELAFAIGREKEEIPDLIAERIHGQISSADIQ